MKIYIPGVKTFIFGQYGSLLITLAVLIFLQPAVHTTLGKYLLEVTFIAVLVAGLRAVDIKKTILRFEVVLLLISLALNISGIVSGVDELFFLGIVVRVIFLFSVVLTILVDLFRSRNVCGDTLAGAVCVYLLIALIWGYCFLLVEFMVPESFSFTQGHSRMQLWISKDFFSFFYFSLVTMTTVGYGDMSPITPVARIFAATEAIVGQLYLTILVARLVGMHLVHQERRDSTDSPEG